MKGREGRADRPLLGSVLALLGLGCIAVFSSSDQLSEHYYGSPTAMVLQHISKVFVGLVLMVVFARIDYRVFRRLAMPLVLISMAMLAMTLIPHFPLAISKKGATRWLDLGFMVVQPAEFAKLSLVVYIAMMLARDGRIRDYKRGFVPVMTVLATFCMFLIQQPNFGNVLCLTLISCAMLYFGGARFTHLATSGLATIPLLTFMAFQKPHVIRRFEGFLHPSGDPLGASFQLRQSLVALGSGGFFGMGPGAGRQSDFFLPDSHTDFVFAILGEDFGLLGTLLVVALFGILLWRGLVVMREAADGFGRYLACGITAMIGIVAFLNMAVVLGLAPTTGLPLPFLSYGGSSMMVNLGGVGILLSIASRSPVKGRWVVK
jgi:cell division protein FtsW